MHGVIGAHGRKGATGSRGASGAAGAASKEPAARHRILVSVSEHIDEIYTELTIQMKRMAQIQMQVDELRAKVKRLTQ